MSRTSFRRGFAGWLSAGCLIGLAAAPASAQLLRKDARNAQPPAKKSAAQDAPAQPAPVGEAVIRRTMVNPTDPICIINGEVLTRQQLADECVARRGEEILESLIARKLIEQALKANKMEVTAAEVEAEIDRVALALAGVDRETWLRNLAKERNISPAQYARDIIYPQLALKKLAEPRVQVTEQDLKDAFESQYGEKLIYRMIVTKDLAQANQMFNELRKNPGGFENMARNDVRSIDEATKPAGGKPMQPMARHSYPREATDKVFQQLVDGDPADKDPSHKPKDGDISGPIQIAQGAWILVKREGLAAAMPHDPTNPEQIKMIKAAIVDSKLQQHMELLMGELVQTAEIENRLKGTVKHANQQVPPPTPEQQRQLATKAAETEKAVGSAIKSPKNDAAVSVTAAQAAAAAKRSVGAPGTVSEADRQLREELEKNADAPLPAYDPSKDPERQPKK